jgi:hypothetical protein
LLIEVISWSQTARELMTDQNKVDPVVACFMCTFIVVSVRREPQAQYFVLICIISLAGCLLDPSPCGKLSPK